MKLQEGADMEREKKTQSVSREMGPGCTSPPPISFFSEGHSGIKSPGRQPSCSQDSAQGASEQLSSSSQQMETSRQDLGRCARVLSLHPASCNPHLEHSTQDSKVMLPRVHT